MGSGGIAPPFMTPALATISGQLHTPAALLLKKIPLYPLDKRLVGLWCTEKLFVSVRNRTLAVRQVGIVMLIRTHKYIVWAKGEVYVY
jgi:hypothetical protein